MPKTFLVATDDCQLLDLQMVWTQLVERILMLGAERCQAFLCNHPAQWHDDWEARLKEQELTYCCGDDCGVHRIIPRHKGGQAA